MHEDWKSVMGGYYEGALYAAKSSVQADYWLQRSVGWPWWALPKGPGKAG